MMIKLIIVGITADEPTLNLLPAFSYLQSLGTPNLTTDSNFQQWSKLAFVIQLGSPYKTLFSVAYPGGQALTLNATLFGKSNNSLIVSVCFVQLLLMSR